MNRNILYILIFLIASACGKQEVRISDTGMVLIPEENEKTGAVRISLLKDDIVRVEASASQDFDTTESLAVLARENKTAFAVVESDQEVILSTKKLSIKISRKSGQIGFYNLDGQPILLEKESKGRSFEPKTVDGVNGYAIRQQFDPPVEEALYGLGQHQADEINYKGKNEELFQYNTKVSIPFIVSSKNYGILWDNYSLTRFGDPRPYTNIDQLELHDKNGQEGGLTATYIDDKNTGQVFLTRTESTIDYENLETISGFPEGFGFENAKITWEGFMEGSETGTYRFLCYYAGYTRLWIDDSLQFNKWRTAWNPSVAKFNIELKEGDRHHVKLEWIPDGGVSYIGLKFLSPVDPEEQNRISFYSEMGKDIRYYFMAGENMDSVISNYRTITGKAQVMPKWSMGFWQSRERYKSQEELLGVLREFRRRHIPIDNIVQDWFYWPEDRWGSHDFDLTRFPDAAEMVREVHDLNAHIMISVWPKFYVNTQHFQEFDRNGWMYRRAVEDSIHDWVGKGYVGSFYDVFNPEARQLFWEQLKENLYVKGFDAWWLDATEPDILSNASISYRKDLMNPTNLGPSTQYFNAYALMNARGIYENQRSVDRDKRVFILTRSGFVGIQAYGAVTWSGDIGTRWEDLKSQISAGINFSMSGLPYWTMDIGGFCVEKRYERAEEGSEDLKEWRELNTRWYQFGTFVPLFRVHGQYPYREIFNIAPVDHPAYQSMLKYDKLRYRLMPYIYSMAGWTYLKDYTIMRGLVMDFTKDEKVYNIGDQYMFGPSIMVCPVYKYKVRSREVYLPESTGWYDIYTGEFKESGQCISAEAPYEHIPLFIKSGSIIPLGPEIEYVSQKPANPITLIIYSGDDATFDLYEDEGNNYNYEKGQYSVIPFSWTDLNRTLTIHPREGRYNGMLDERVFHVVIASKAIKIPLGPVTRGYLEVVYNGSRKEISF